VAGSTGTAGTGMTTGTGGTTSPPPRMIETCKCETAEGPGPAGIVLLLAAFAIAGARRRRDPASRRR
jgi:MYXO-CTERM domain-containing protein